ncbi:RDD family protein [Roseovarius sp. PS-C2]|uniref:RDD family protein n=1 Tax=Roseovarius sp. PS-C2 TaxID=2820814 RepID=UPI001C0AAA94|nr:RDD family protein [Roseovarius sp. PS-C2]MBU3261306.1 RDD family protein [Roseovarius sp. PS-C2]
MTEYSWHLPDPVTQPEFYSDVPAKRLLAWVVDTVLIVLICLLIVPFTAFTGLFFFPFLMLIVGFAYRVVTIARGSATWGMRLVSLEFRKLDGQRFDLSMALLHTLGLTISFGFPILQVISIVLMLTTERGQGLSDHVLGTVALNRRATA